MKNTIYFFLGIAFIVGAITASIENKVPVWTPMVLTMIGSMCLLAFIESNYKKK